MTFRTLLATSPRWLLAWGPEFLRLGRRHLRSRMRLLGAAVLVGLVAGLAAIVFFAATRTISHFALGELAGYRPEPQPTGEARLRWLPPATTVFRPWLLLVLPMIGGLASGLIVFTLAPEAEGHGTDAVIGAYHTRNGKIRPRVPLVKIVASALTIGTGGSGGREGPIAQIGAGFGSFLARALRLSPADRRVLCAAGMGAGVAAIFRAPLAGALFASEVLYHSPEFEPEVIIPAGIASVVSYCTYAAVFGWTPLFSVADIRFSAPVELLAYLLLAAVVVVLAAIYTRTFYATTRAFHRLRLPPALRPALGAGASGAIALALYFALGRERQVLNVLSFGYAALENALTHETDVAAIVLLTIALGKIVTTSLTIGSGGSGGVFGPSMVIGGCGGGALGVVLHHHWPVLVPHPASFVLVGMAGFFAAAAKTPFSTLVIVSEMTGGYHLLLPALWVCVLAFMLSDRRSIYSEQIETRSSSPAHRGTFVRALMDGTDISAFVVSAPTVLRPRDTLPVVIERISAAGFGMLPVVDDEARLLGIVTVEEALIASAAPGLVVAADMIREVTPLTVGDPLDVAQERFVEADVLALPVVDDRIADHVVGVVKRIDVAGAYVRRVHGPRSLPPDASDSSLVGNALDAAGHSGAPSVR